MNTSWPNDPIICSIVEELKATYNCHTIILYGSRARGDFTSSSDYDIAGITAVGDKKWIARFDEKNLVFHDIFIYPKKEVAIPNESHLQMSDGIVILDFNNTGKHLLQALKSLEQKPLPISEEEIQARKTWYQKMLVRAELGDLEGKYRHIWSIFTLLEDYFAFKKMRYQGPKKAFLYLSKQDPEILNLFGQALSNTNDIQSLKQLINKITNNKQSLKSELMTPRPDNSSAFKVALATRDQQSVIAQLYELYTYEMTDLADFDINENGFFGYPELPSYWKESNKHPYLIWINKKLAGFVLIQKGSPIDDNPEIWDIAEFFIMRKFRQKGIGELVAGEIFSLHRGAWQVRVWDNNKVAHTFWDHIIKRFTQKSVVPTQQTYQGHEGLLVYTFYSPSLNN